MEISEKTIQTILHALAAEKSDASNDSAAGAFATAMHVVDHHATAFWEATFYFPWEVKLADVVPGTALWDAAKKYVWNKSILSS